MSYIINRIQQRDPEEDLIYQAVQTARKINPGIHFQRLVPHEITGDFNTVETSLERFVQMEDEIQDFLRKTVKLRSRWMKP